MGIVSCHFSFWFVSGYTGGVGRGRSFQADSISSQCFCQLRRRTTLKTPRPARIMTPQKTWSSWPCVKPVTREYKPNAAMAPSSEIIRASSGRLVRLGMFTSTPGEVFVSGTIGQNTNSGSLLLVFLMETYISVQ
jgi:hypothetical protein